MAKKVDFLGGNTGNVRTELRERKKYKDLVDFPEMIDVLYDKFSYGMINANFEPVYLIDEPDIFATFPGYAPDVRCLGFVASAFDAFYRDYVEKISNSNRGFPPYLNSARPRIGYEPFMERYGDYITYVSINYSNELKNNVHINDYTCYLDVLKKFMSESLKNHPITPSGVILSRHNTPRTTGLVLEFSNLDYNDDLQKGTMIQSIDFQCYLDYASNYGFYIDKYAPWRLYANLEHPTIAAYLHRGERIQNNNLTNVSVSDNMDSIYRLKAHRDDLYYLQDFVLKLYNDIVDRVPYFYRFSGSIREEVFRTDVEMLKGKEWLELLLFVRMHELEIYNEQDFLDKKKTLIKNYELFGIESATEWLGMTMARQIKEIYDRSRQNYSNT